MLWCYGVGGDGDGTVGGGALVILGESDAAGGLFASGLPPSGSNGGVSITRWSSSLVFVLALGHLVAYDDVSFHAPWNQLEILPWWQCIMLSCALARAPARWSH